MKTTFTVGALLLFGAGAWAQSGADEAAIKDRVMQSTKDAYSLRQAEYEAGMTDKASMIQVSNHRSGYQVYQPGTTLAAVFGSKPREINPRPDNFTFRFYGPNAAFVTYDQNLYDKPSKEIRMMEKQNGQWKTAASMSYWDYGQNTFEEGLVRKIVETETRSFHEANGDLLKAQWSDKPYAERQQANLQEPTGSPYLKGDKLKAFADAYFKTLKPSGHTVRLSDYDVHISGATAWATFTQEKLDGSGNVVGKQREVRILEREPAGWKIVFLGLQPMK